MSLISRDRRAPMNLVINLKKRFMFFFAAYPVIKYEVHNWLCLNPKVDDWRTEANTFLLPFLFFLLCFIAVYYHSYFTQTFLIHLILTSISFSFHASITPFSCFHAYFPHSCLPHLGVCLILFSCLHHAFLMLLSYLTSIFLERLLSEIYGAPIVGINITSSSIRQLLAFLLPG